MELLNVYKSLRAGAEKLAQLDAAQKNKALLSVKEALNLHRKEILQANSIDVQNSRDKGVKESLIDRLTLTDSRIDSILAGIDSVAKQTDPVGQVVSGWTTPNGMQIRQVRVPFGVAAIIYESRPNVTVDAFSLAYKSGNAILLRGSSSAIESNKAIVSAIKEGLKAEPCGIPEAIELAVSGKHEEVDEILTAKGYIDVVLPRGGANLIKMVVDKAKVPVIETGRGICHVFVDESADLEMALNIAENAKLQRPGVCNAIECILVHKAAAEKFLPALYERFNGRAQLRCDEVSYKILSAAASASASAAGKEDCIIQATDEDFDTEFLDNILAVKVLDDVKEAVAFINAHNTKHSESIVTKSLDNAKYFQRNVDAACVYVNASTRFTDGEEFGFGAELGISTQKMHVRGPMGCSALTTIKYLIDGNVQIR